MVVETSRRGTTLVETSRRRGYTLRYTSRRRGYTLRYTSRRGVTPSEDQQERCNTLRGPAGGGLAT